MRSSAKQDHSSLCLCCRDTSEGKGRLKRMDEAMEAIGKDDEGLTPRSRELNNGLSLQIVDMQYGR